MTGFVTDVDRVAVLLHRHGALSFWDYAAAGPYLPIDMNDRPAWDRLVLAANEELDNRRRTLSVALGALKPRDRRIFESRRLTDDPMTNKFVFPTNTVIQPRGFVVYDQAQLGFALSASGETIYFADPNNMRVIDAVRFGAQENGVSTGRYPDGAAGLYRLETKTPGARNGPRRAQEVVINEIMYGPISGESDDEYVELHNLAGGSLDVGRWSFTDGIEYTFPAGTVIPADGYLVIAKNEARLLTNYANLTGANTLGNFAGTLAHARAVVATRVGGVPEVVDDGVSGVLVPAADASALAHAIVEMLQVAPRRAAMGEIARARIVRDFSVHARTERLLALYAGLLRRRPDATDQTNGPGLGTRPVAVR